MFGGFFFDLKAALVEGAAFFVGGDLVEFAEVKGIGDGGNHLEGAAEEEFFVQPVVRDGSAVLMATRSAAVRAGWPLLRK